MTAFRSRRASGRVASGCGRQWTPQERVALITAVAICLGCLFLTTYSLALADPVPHRIDAGLIGDPRSAPSAVHAVQEVTRGSVVFHRYTSTAAAAQAMAWQRIYATLRLSSRPPTLYVSTAAGNSVARVLEGVFAVDRSLQVVDAHPLIPADPNGVNLFYLMLVATIVGFVSVFQVRAHVTDLTFRHHVAFVVSIAAAASCALVLVDAALLHRLAVRDVEEWAILATHLLAVSSYTLLMAALIGRWAVVPTYVFFVILGNTSSGGAVAPPLLPEPFAFLSSWLPSGATVTALRNAVYFREYQHARPLIVLAAWAIVLFSAWAVIARAREARTARFLGSRMITAPLDTSRTRTMRPG